MKDKVPSQAVTNFHLLSDAMQVRADVVAAFYACSRTTVWRRVKDGHIPAPIKLGRTVVWNVGQLRASMPGAAI